MELNLVFGFGFDFRLWFWFRGLAYIFRSSVLLFAWVFGCWFVFCQCSRGFGFGSGWFSVLGLVCAFLLEIGLAFLILGFCFGLRLVVVFSFSTIHSPARVLEPFHYCAVQNLNLTRIEAFLPHKGRAVLDPFSTAVSFWGQTTQFSRNFPQNGTAVLVRQTTVNRTHGTHKNLYVPLFLRTILGSIYCGPP